MFRVGVSDDGYYPRADVLRWTVARCRFSIVPVNLHEPARGWGTEHNLRYATCAECGGNIEFFAVGHMLFHTGRKCRKFFFGSVLQSIRVWRKNQQDQHSLQARHRELV